MPIIVQCSCGKRLSAKDELRGKRVKCPGCQTLLTVPAQGASNEAITTEPAADAYAAKQDAAKKKSEWKPIQEDEAGERYVMEGEDVPRSKAAKSRAERIEASIRKRKKRKLTLWDKGLRWIGLKPKPMNYEVRIGNSELTMNARMMAEQLVKGELHLGTEVKLLDPNAGEEDRDWTTIEDGPARKNFFVRRLYDPIGAFGAHGAQLGMAYVSIFMWIIAPLILFTASSIAEHGAIGLLYGPLIAVAYVGITFLVVGVSLWLISQDNQAVVIIIYLLFGCAPLFIVLGFVITQAIYMGIGFVMGWAVGAIIGAIRQSEFRRPGT